jgi:signal transduction histidine kinase
MMLEAALLVSAISTGTAIWCARMARRAAHERQDAVERCASLEEAARRAARNQGMRDAELAIERAARQRLESTLLQSSRFEQVGRLTAGLAHDLNNLLTILLGHADVLASASSTDPSLREEIDQLQASITRAARLTGRILSFGRQESATPDVVDLAALVRGLEGLLRRIASARIGVEFVMGDGAYVVAGDGAQLEQVLINLVSNARDAMPQGGRLTVAVTGRQLDGGELRRDDDIAAGDYVEVTVTDTGTGMTEDVKHRIFEPFFTTKPQGKGTGIGLASSLGIIERFGGRMTVDSEVGTGATFRILLPIVAAAAEGDAAARVVA